MSFAFDMIKEHQFQGIFELIFEYLKTPHSEMIIIKENLVECLVFLYMRVYHHHPELLSNLIGGLSIEDALIFFYKAPLLNIKQNLVIDV